MDREVLCKVRETTKDFASLVKPEFCMLFFTAPESSEDRQQE